MVHCILQILLGLRDTSEELAEASLRALADLIPILGRDVIIGGKTKNYFRKGMPKVCIGLDKEILFALKLNYILTH